MLFKKLWLIILAAIIVGAGASVAVKVTETKTYTSKMSFIVNTLADNELVNNSDVAAAINVSNTFKYILGSRSMMEVVSASLDFEISASALISCVSVTSVSSVNAIELLVKTNDAQKSLLIAEAIADNYSDFVKEKYPNASLNICDRPIKASHADTNTSYLMVGAVFAVVGAVVVVLIIIISYLLKNTVHTTDDIRNKIGIGVLGMIMQADKKILGNKRSMLITDRRSGFSFIETYKAIRTKIESDSAKNGHKVFLVTSAVENEGKTTVATNIAIALAQNENSVLLIDSDLRKPSVCKTLNVASDYNIADLCRGKATLEDSIKYIEKFNLFILANQIPSAEPSEIISSAKMDAILKTVRAEFDYVIIDTPPASVVTDAAAMGQHSDAAIIVIRDDSAPINRIRMAVADIENSGVEIIGSVYNNVSVSTSRSIGRSGKYGVGYQSGSYSYGYSYGSGYSKGYGYTPSDKSKKD